MKRKYNLPKIQILGLGGLASGVLGILPLQKLQDLGCLKITAIDSHPNEVIKLPTNIIYTEGFGTGGDLEKGSELFAQIRSQVETEIDESDFVVCLSGLGGGTGSSFLKEIVDLCNQKSKTCLVIATSPNMGEQLSKSREEKFREVIDYIQDKCSFTILDMVKIQRSSSYSQQVLEQVGSELMCCVNSLIMMTSRAGFDAQDLHKTFSNKGMMFIRTGTGKDIEECLNMCLDKKYNYNWLTTISDCAYTIEGDNLTTEDDEKVIIRISRYADSNFDIKGKLVNRKDETVRLYLIMTGMASSYNRQNKTDLSHNLGIFHEIMQTDAGLNRLKAISSTEDLYANKKEIINIAASTKSLSKAFAKLHELFEVKISYTTFAKFLKSIEVEVEEKRPIVEITTVYDN
jgi:cell division GTPase FtsZ